MSDKSQKPREWLNIKEASKQLGVHPTTLRRWADNGKMPVMLTPGGHRRFAVTDIDQFTDQRSRLRMVSGIEQIWAEQAIKHTRHEIETHADERWLQVFDNEERENTRLLGRRLMGIIIQYVSLDDGGEALLEEARSIGADYAHEVLRLGLSITAALQAAMFFRDSLVEAAILLPETAHLRPEANTRLLRRINTLINAVQLAIVETHENSRSQ